MKDVKARSIPAYKLGPHQCRPRVGDRIMIVFLLCHPLSLPDPLTKFLGILEYQFPQQNNKQTNKLQKCYSLSRLKGFNFLNLVSVCGVYHACVHVWKSVLASNVFHCPAWPCLSRQAFSWNPNSDSACLCPTTARATDVHEHPWDLCGCWGFELRSSWHWADPFISWAVSPAICFGFLGHLYGHVCHGTFHFPSFTTSDDRLQTSIKRFLRPLLTPTVVFAVTSSAVCWRLSSTLECPQYIHLWNATFNE